MVTGIIYARAFLLFLSLLICDWAICLLQSRASLGLNLAEGNVLAGQSGSRIWHNLVSYGGFGAQNTWLSLGFFNHKYHNLVHLICCYLVSFDLSVIPEGEILEQIRESPFLSFPF